MSCLQCGTQLCQCLNQGYLRQAQQSAQGLNYQAMQQASINQSLRVQMSDHDPDYQLFKKYAHLTEQEMMEVFLGEQKEMVRQAEEGAKMLVQKAKDRNEEAKKAFWQWCSKFRRHMTEERFNTYFKMFL